MIKNITTFHSLLFHNNTTNHVQPNTSVLKQNAFIANGFNSSSSAASTSHEITVPNFLANDATLHGILISDTQDDHPVRSSHVIGQAAYQKKKNVLIQTMLILALEILNVNIVVLCFGL
ncbi:hypothetical protein ACFXTO_013955 [Malus domestica]